jgi:SpoVK/Ycf46/Vps4 family AAA+-type ATPase
MLRRLAMPASAKSKKAKSGPSAAGKAGRRRRAARVPRRPRAAGKRPPAGKPLRSLGVRVLLVGNDRKRLRATADEMAAKLSRSLLPADLAAIVSKYIGETEKNLDRIFVRAESLGAVLFFDEADALFGKRSEVEDSHSRYLNFEVDYLMQRIEAFSGLVILASNCKENLDPALLRRLHFIIPLPTSSARGPTKSKNTKGR